MRPGKALSTDATGTVYLGGCPEVTPGAWGEAVAMAHMLFPSSWEARAQALIQAQPGGSTYCGL